MVRTKSSVKSRIAWLAMHGGFLAWGLCLIVIAEDHRDGGDQPAIAERQPASGSNVRDAGAKNSQTWLVARIENLGNRNYGVRAKATRELLAAGPGAVDQLARALLSHDPEVVRRSQYILSQLIRGNEACLLALEDVSHSPDHPAAHLAQAIHEQEANRRERLKVSLIAQRHEETQRLLREARADLYKNRFAEAREKAAAAKALGGTFDLFDDRPELVQSAIEQAEARTKVSQVSAKTNSPQ